MMRQKDLAAVRKLREQKLQEEEERQVRARDGAMLCSGVLDEHDVFSIIFTISP